MTTQRTKILGVIPARSGSKGVPNKNTRPLAGRSLIERAFDSAQSARIFDRLILSSDDPVAMQVARTIGLEVPFIRPSSLAEDTTPMLSVVRHVLEELDPSRTLYDAVMVLQPTSPLRQAAHLREALRLYERFTATGVCSVTPIPQDRCPHYLLRVNERGLLESFMPDGFAYTRRQDVPRAYRRCGTLFLTDVRTLIEEQSFYGSRCIPLVMAPQEAINIDGPEDWEAAEAWFRAPLTEVRDAG